MKLVDYSFLYCNEAWIQNYSYIELFFVTETTQGNYSLIYHPQRHD